MTIDRELHSGRPTERRIPKEERCYELLDRLGIDYFRADHDRADTIGDCKEVEKVLGCAICKNLLLTNRQQTALYLLLLPGDKPFYTKILSKEIGSSRLSFATAEQMEKYLDITPGSVSVLGLMNDGSGAVKFLVDRELLDDEYLGCHPCINTSTLKIKLCDLLERILPATGHEPTYVNLPWESESAL